MRRLSAVFALALLAAFATVPRAHADGTAQLMKVDRTVGSGPAANDGDVVHVDYTGWLYDAGAKDHHGRKFDSSYDNGRPISFTLGAGQVIEGWDQGILGMRVGGRRTLVIPARLAYGSRGAGDDIPPDATLVFDVVLEGVN
jgi:FKBP-type peptidyl-prolyl cis-trans isomerase FkpA